MNEKMFNLHKKFLDMVDTFHDAEQEMQWYLDTVDELEVQLKHLENIEIGNHELELKNSRLENEAQSMAEHITELEQTVLKQNELIVKQKQELEGLLSKHNTEVLKANTAINSLESQLNNANRSRAYLEKKAAKTKKGLPQTAEDWNAVQPIWKEGVESLFPTFSKTTFHDDKGNPVVLENSYWWRHAKGIQLLCAWSPQHQEVMICDPRIDDNNIVLPSETATNKIKELICDKSRKVA